METSLKSLSFKDQAGLIKLDALLRFEENIVDPAVEPATLIRFLRAKNFDVESAKLAVLAFLAWNKSISIEKLANTIAVKGAAFSKLFDINFFGVDLRGRPLCIIRPGTFDPDTFLDLFTVDEVVLLTRKGIERLIQRVFPACSVKANRTIFSMTSILDIKNLSVSKIIMNKSLLEFIQTLSKIFQNNYPEIMSKFLIINASSFFYALYHIITLFVSKKTEEKGTVLGADYKTELLKYLSSDNLPMTLGGTSQFLENQYPNHYDKEDFLS
jgi:hypothetical protein